MDVTTTRHFSLVTRATSSPMPAWNRASVLSGCVAVAFQRRRSVTRGEDRMGKLGAGSCPVTQRNRRKKARRSSTRRCGSSIAGKCPPFGIVAQNFLHQLAPDLVHAHESRPGGSLGKAEAGQRGRDDVERVRGVTAMRRGDGCRARRHWREIAGFR